MRGRRWLIAVVSLGLALLAGGIGEVAAASRTQRPPWPMPSRPGPPRFGCRPRRRTSRPGLFRVRPTPGAVLAMWDWPGTIASLPFRGGVRLLGYGVPANSWTSMTGAPNAVGAGGALAYDGVRYIYAFRGDNSRTFWRYDTTTRRVAGRANAPANVGAGGALAYGGSGTSMRSGATTDDFLEI